VRVKAQGGGFNAVYESQRWRDGWCFVTKDNTVLTPGIGKPMCYPTKGGLLEAVRQRPGVEVTVLES